MQNQFVYEKISAKAYEYLKERLSYNYVTIRHYRFRWHPVKEYMDRCNIEFINPEVCNNFLFELYNGRCHTDLTDNEIKANVRLFFNSCSYNLIKSLNRSLLFSLCKSNSASLYSILLSECLG